MPLEHLQAAEGLCAPLPLSKISSSKDPSPPKVDALLSGGNFYKDFFICCLALSHYNTF